MGDVQLESVNIQIPISEMTVTPNTSLVSLNPVRYSPCLCLARTPSNYTTTHNVHVACASAFI